ncbi:hypothetical protein [Staphylococcus caeli]|uniref:hypothetical protein n=1 Tax=Staphylococcus caeli TaxID=2201815 RepID=UPI003F55C54F
MKNGKLTPIDYSKAQFIKVVVQESIYPEHRSELLALYSTITDIKENEVIINENSNEYNDIIKYLVQEYTLVSSSSTQDNLYQYFDDLEKE